MHFLFLGFNFQDSVSHTYHNAHLCSIDATWERNAGIHLCDNLGSRVLSVFSSYEDGPNLNVRHQITSTYLMQKKIINKAKKQYVLLFLFHLITFSIQTLIPSFYQFKYSFKVVSFPREVKYCLTVFCSTFHEFLLFDFPLSNLRQRHNFLQRAGPWSASVSLWIIIQCRSAKDILTANTHWPAMNLALTRSFCLQESDHRADLKLGILLLFLLLLLLRNVCIVPLFTLLFFGRLD
jgi:hypothetical protein